MVIVVDSANIVELVASLPTVYAILTILLQALRWCLRLHSGQLVLLGQCLTQLSQRPPLQLRGPRRRMEELSRANQYPQTDDVEPMGIIHVKDPDLVTVVAIAVTGRKPNIFRLLFVK